MSVLSRAQQKFNDPVSVKEKLRDQTREVVRAYRHSWDIYSELLQNSVDAINRRFRILNDPQFRLYEEYHQRFPELSLSDEFQGKIFIEINVAEKTIEVLDNGVGIPHDRFEDFLLPEGGDKRQGQGSGQEYGFKGYGLTYVAFISRDFYLRSRFFQPSSNPCYEIRLQGLFDWIADHENRLDFPNGPVPDAREAVQLLDDEWNTSVKVQLADTYYDKFQAVSAVDHAIDLAADRNRIRGFEYILRSRTALGNTRPLFNRQPIVPIDINLRVIHDDGQVSELSIPYEYYHPKDHEEISIISYNFDEYVDKLVTATFNPNFRGLYHTVTNESVGIRRGIRCDFALAAIASRRLSNIEASLGLDQFDTGDVGISYGIHLAIDGMPTGLRVDDWDNRGSFLKRYFVVVDASMDLSNQLDPGRKGISPYFAGAISQHAIKLLNEARITDKSDTFARFASRYLDYGQGPEEGGLPPTDFQDRINVVEERENEDARREPELLSALRKISSLLHLPQNEQEVIALFYELQAREIIKGYQTKYLSSSAAYDAAFEYKISVNDENVYPNDPLGIGRVLAQHLMSRGKRHYVHAEYGRMPYLCVDFKWSIGGFIQEIITSSGKTNKDPDVIDIVICWTDEIAPTVPKEAFTLDRIQDDRRKFHSTSHVLGLRREYNTSVECIILREVLKSLLQTATG